MSGSRARKLREAFESKNPALCKIVDYRHSNEYKTAWRLFKKLITRRI